MKDQRSFCGMTRDHLSSVKDSTKLYDIQPLTKVVIRRLPPRLTKDELLEQLSSSLPAYNYFYFVEPDWTFGQYAFARAYINFVNAAEVFTFKNRYDGYQFYDSKNRSSCAVVEYAPFQRIPKQRFGRRKDEKCGTIETCYLYKKFVEQFQTVSDERKTNSFLIDFNKEYSKNLDMERKKLISTPLLDYIKQYKDEKYKQYFPKRRHVQKR